MAVVFGVGVETVDAVDAAAGAVDGAGSLARAIPGRVRVKAINSLMAPERRIVCMKTSWGGLTAAG